MLRFFDGGEYVRDIEQVNAKAIKGNRNLQSFGL